MIALKLTTDRPVLLSDVLRCTDDFFTALDKAHLLALEFQVTTRKRKRLGGCAASVEPTLSPAFRMCADALMLGLEDSPEHERRSGHLPAPRRRAVRHRKRAQRNADAGAQDAVRVPLTTRTRLPRTALGLGHFCVAAFQLSLIHI